MCLSRSKRSQEDEVSTPKTTETEKEMAKMKCPEGSKPCNSTSLHCSMHGRCCYKNGEKEFCKCEHNRKGLYCESQSYVVSSAELFGSQTVAVSGAVLGLAVIILFFVVIVLLIRNDRKQKKCRHNIMSADDDDHEQNKNKISRPDASDKGSKKVLITQPGYSWRESVRRTGSKAANKFRNTLSRSVPDDLFGVGVKLAIIGGFKPTDRQSTVGKAAGAKAPTTDRCFSAGDRQVICHQKDNANNEPIAVQIPAATTGEAATEDTVM
jgi:hypothetical protein